MGIDPSGRWLFVGMGVGMCPWREPDGTAAATVTAGRRNPAAPAHPKNSGWANPEGHSRIRRGTAIPEARNTPGHRCDRPGATSVPLHRRDQVCGGWGQGCSCTPSLPPLPSPSDNPIFEPGD